MSDYLDILEDKIAELEAEVQHQVERREEEKLRAVNAEAELSFVREWFENILPNDWDKCMERWVERSTL